jgi:hypothetical protein
MGRPIPVKKARAIVQHRPKPTGPGKLHVHSAAERRPLIMVKGKITIWEEKNR